MPTANPQSSSQQCMMPCRLPHSFGYFSPNLPKFPHIKEKEHLRGNPPITHVWHDTRKHGSFKDIFKTRDIYVCAASTINTAPKWKKKRKSLHHARGIICSELSSQNENRADALSYGTLLYYHARRTASEAMNTLAKSRYRSPLSLVEYHRHDKKKRKLYIYRFMNTILYLHASTHLKKGNGTDEKHH